jgi:hypothetical protein
VHQILDPPVAERGHQPKAGQGREVRTSEVMSEINAKNNEHRKDFRYKENPDDESNKLLYSL